MIRSRLSLKHKNIPSCERRPSELDGVPLSTRYGDVSGLAERIAARVRDEGESLWTLERSNRENIRLRRAFHDSLGVQQTIFKFCDDLFTTCFELPYYNDWRDLLEPLWEALGLSSRQVIRCLLARMPPGVTIPVHHDTGRWSLHSHRVHVPIITSEQEGDPSSQVVFKVGVSETGLDRVPFEQGYAVELNNRAKHAVQNNWSQARVHLIFDWVEAKDLIPQVALSQGQTVFQSRRAIFLDKPDFLPRAFFDPSAVGFDRKPADNKSSDSIDPVEAKVRMEKSKRILNIIDKESGGNSDRREFMQRSRRFADGECSASEYLAYCCHAAGSRKRIFEIFESVDLVGLVQDQERSAALKHAYLRFIRGPQLFFVLGVMKCGTTSLFDYISQHQNIAPAKGKEPHFFDWKWQEVMGFNVPKKAASQLELLCEKHWLSRTFCGTDCFPYAVSDCSGPGDDKKFEIDDLNARHFHSVLGACAGPPLAPYPMAFTGDSSSFPVPALPPKLSGEELAVALQRRRLFFSLFQFHELMVRPDLFAAGEATPSYLLGGKTLAERIRDTVGANLKLVVILRDPVKRAYSQYQMTADPNGTPEQRKRRGNVAGKSFEEIVFEDIAKLDSLGCGAGVDPRKVDLDLLQREYFDKTPMGHGSHSYVGRGLYTLQLIQWLKVFPRDNFLVLKLEDLSKNVQRETNKVFAFLGLPAAPVADVTPKNARSYEPMSPKIEQKLRAFYEPHNQALAELLGPEFKY